MRWNPRTGETLIVDRDPDGLVVIAQKTMSGEGLTALPVDYDEARWLASAILVVLPPQRPFSEDCAKPLDERIAAGRAEGA